MSVFPPVQGRPTGLHILIKSGPSVVADILTRAGFSDGAIAWWWERPHPDLSGLPPRQVFAAGDDGRDSVIGVAQAEQR